MKNPVREEGADLLTDSAFENGAQISGVKAGASNKRNATSLALHVSSACQGHSLSRYVDADDIETHIEKVERISSISAAPIDNFYAFRPAETVIQDCLGKYSCSGAWCKSP